MCCGFQLIIINEGGKKQKTWKVEKKTILEKGLAYLMTIWDEVFFRKEEEVKKEQRDTENKWEKGERKKYKREKKQKKMNLE